VTCNRFVRFANAEAFKSSCTEVYDSAYSSDQQQEQACTQQRTVLLIAVHCVEWLHSSDACLARTKCCCFRHELKLRQRTLLSAVNVNLHIFLCTVRLIES
jgi:hypothetical protein